MKHVAWVVEDQAGARLDRYVADRLDLSRNRVITLLAEGRILVDGERPRKSHTVVAGQRITVEVPPPEELDARPQDIPVPILYQDEDLAVIDKPAGLVVHPAPGHPSGTLVNALLHHIGDLSGIGGKLRPGIVHRLDKDTSGLMVVAKSDRAHRVLSAALKARRVRRTYAAALWGHLDLDVTEVDAPLGRDPKDRKRMAVRSDGREARSRFRARERWRAATLAHVDLETGRTHQIRVHAAHLGHPVVGDSLYGRGRERGFSGPGRAWAAELARRTERQFLHAIRLRFDHPVTGREMAFESPLPVDLEEVRSWALSTSI